MTRPLIFCCAAISSAQTINVKNNKNVLLKFISFIYLLIIPYLYNKPNLSSFGLHLWLFSEFGCKDIHIILKIIENYLDILVF